MAMASQALAGPSHMPSHTAVIRGEPHPRLREALPSAAWQVPVQAPLRIVRRQRTFARGSDCVREALRMVAVQEQRLWNFDERPQQRQLC
jgi:hypothetical protein